MLSALSGGGWGVIGGGLAMWHYGEIGIYCYTPMYPQGMDIYEGRFSTATPAE